MAVMALLAVGLALALLYFTRSPMTGFAIGLLALLAAWFSGQRYLLRQLQSLIRAAERLVAGDLAARTGLSNEPGEIGQLARTLDSMATTIEQRARERDQAEQRLFHRALQQTAVAALGQFALVSDDFSALLNQAATLVSQTLETEYCRILELLPDAKALRVRAGIGWKKEHISSTSVAADPNTQAGYTLTSGEPVIITELRNDARFRPDQMLDEHGIVSGVSVAIRTHERVFGTLGAYSGKRREFTSDDIQFLLAVANALAVAVDRRRAEANLRKLAEFAQLSPNPAMELSANAVLTYHNQAAAKLATSVGHKHPQEVLPPDIAKIVATCLATGQSQLNIESRIEGHVLSWSFHPVTASHAVHCYVTDITDRLNLEAQLRQSQKMESIGQLAAGIAHDFNNMLTVIQGHTGMLLQRPGVPGEIRDSAQAIGFAAERASNLTRQLLTFSRKTVMQPQLLDLREVIGNLTKMLKRLLGETIEVEFNPPAGIPLIHGDTGMVEQIILNLAVNARDAMSDGGRLAIGLDPMTVDAAYVRTHPEARTGPFVCLRVSDNGCGMDGATLSRIFEPFFTTKGVGKGTGLGLATVYGIVKQHHGWIDVTSQIGKGTAFDVFFPATAGAGKPMKSGDGSADAIRGGTETILLVEDEALVLKLGSAILLDCGYDVLPASSGLQALDLWQRHPGKIHLLLTDVVMPEGLSGMDLARYLLNHKPDLKVLFTSGYKLDDLGSDFIRKGEAAFLQKPYTRSSLARAVRSCLDQAQAPRPAAEDKASAKG